MMPAREMPAATAQAGRVVIVDDEPELALELMFLLEREGIEVLVQSSRIPLAQTVCSTDPDVIFVDVTVPALLDACFDACQRATADAPLVVLFCRSQRRELSRLTEILGADGFVCKDGDSADAVLRTKTWVNHRQFLRSINRGGYRDATHTASSTPN